MTQLPAQSYEILRQVLEVMALPAEEVKDYEEKFERKVMVEFAAAIVKKLPEVEAKKTTELANNATTPEQKQQLQQQLQNWLTPEETKDLFQKVADQVFAKFVQIVYKGADENQKKQLEEQFDVNVLKG